MQGVLRLALMAALIGASLGASLWVGRGRADSPRQCLTYRHSEAYATKNRTLIDLAANTLIRYQRPYSPQIHNPTPLSQQPIGPYTLRLAPENFDYQSLLLAVRGRESESLTLQTGIFQRVRVQWSPNGRWLVVKANQPDRSSIVTVHGPFPTEGEALPTVLRKQEKALSETAIFFDWSPDSRHLAYKESAKQELFLWEVETGTHTPYLMGNQHYAVYGPAWSPDGQHFALIFNFARSSRLVRVTVGGAIHRADMGSAVDRADFVWSPDSQHVAVRFPDGAYRVLRGDGTLSQVIGLASAVTWARDSRTVYTSNVLRDDEDFTVLGWSWAAYDVQNSTLTPLASNLPVMPSLSPTAPRRVAVIGAAAGKRALTLMNVDGAEQMTIIPAADEIGAVTWSPDGAYMAVAWRQAGEAHITWVRADGTAAHTWGDRLSAARNLRWMGDQIAFIAQRRAPDGMPTYSLESLSLTDGEHRVWLTGKQELGYVVRLPDGVLQLWWEADGQIGVVGYGPNGQQQFAYAVPAKGLRQFADRALESDEISPTYGGRPYLFRTQMGSAAFLYLAPDADYRAFFISGQQEPIKLREAVTLLAAPALSDDGQAVAFYQREGEYRFRLRAVNAAGQEVYRSGLLRYPGSELAWSSCAVLAAEMP